MRAGLVAVLQLNHVNGLLTFRAIRDLELDVLTFA